MFTWAGDTHLRWGSARIREGTAPTGPRGARGADTVLATWADLSGQRRAGAVIGN